MKKNEPKSRRLPLWKKLVFAVAAFFVLMIVAEVALRLAGAILRPQVIQSDARPDCDALVFLCLGDSITLGKGTRADETFPMLMAPLLMRDFPGIAIKTYNAGVSGTNTSEGLGILEDFLQRRPDARPDFALVMYGFNNRWNLHDATFWEWEKQAKKQYYLDFLSSRLRITRFVNLQHLADVFEIIAYAANKLKITKLFRVADENLRALNDSGPDGIKSAYRNTPDDQGWAWVFHSFKQQPLARWIQHDIEQFAHDLRATGIEPIFLTYHYERIDVLNDIIRKSAIKVGAKLIDLERPVDFYVENDFLDQDKFHLNAAGNAYLAEQVTQQFSRIFSDELLMKRLGQKRERPNCLNHSTSN